MAAVAPSTSDRDPDGWRLMVFGRLTAGTTLEQASTELHGLAATLPRTSEPTRPSDSAWVARPLISRDADADSRMRGLLVGVVALVLIVACTNLANLRRARGAGRQRDHAIRMSLGASRLRLIWEQCVESGILAIAGLIVAYAAFEVIAAMMTADFSLGSSGVPVALSIRPTMNAPVVTAGVMATMLAVLIFGLEPA